MAYQSLYRRYRPQRFSQVVGQDHVVRALSNSVRENRVGHAYLFSGPRGTGKTSTARILAKVLNCAAPADGEPCGTCASCQAVEAGTSLDVIELDAASHNGVDDMRELVSNAALGSPGRTKLYILDEVHMLSKAASNALLKTLEEPPGHVVFVLATTDPQKVLPTIRSRTQHFEFHLLSADQLADHVRKVAADAGLDLPEEAIEYAVRRGAGSARDALSALEQVAAAGLVTEDDSPVTAVMDALCERDSAGALVAVARAASLGRDANDLAAALMERLRNAFLSAMAPDLVQVTDAERDQVAAEAERLRPPAIVRALELLGEAMVEMRQAPDPRVPLELALVRLTRPEADPSPAALLERIERLERGVQPATTPEPAPAAQPPARTPPPKTQRADPSAARPPLGTRRAAPDAAPAAAPEEPAPTAEPARDLPSRDELTLAWGDSIWPGLAPAVKARFGAGRFVGVEGGVAAFALPNAAHRDMCEGLRGEVEQALAAHFGRRVPMRLVVDDGRPASNQLQPAEEAEEEVIDLGETLDAPPGPAPGLDRLTEAFPGAELVEDDEENQ